MNFVAHASTAFLRFNFPQSRREFIAFRHFARVASGFPRQRGNASENRESFPTC
jgi:hypothetical protein